ncbi:torsin-1A-interacting protein 1-like isoform X2 [Betta splendens]|uniref:Torsin-1A-interacting protein 1-like isoform X2 n=1 Tax=Betta splendens TaxID=158456 RepID=A0A6P7MCA9_BETSP|nr:torsin-1A-interacting protein 1-like isoform X2 [Betta splendens]
MDSKISENNVSRPLRRSTRQSSIKALGYEATPRGPLKRAKEAPENPVVNGSKEVENGSEDEESPNKKSRLNRGESVGDSGDENGMEVQDSPDDFETKQDQGQQKGQDSSCGIHQPKICQGAIGDVNLSPRVLLGERCQSRHAVNENADGMRTKTVKPPTREPAAPIKSAVQTRSSLSKHDTTASKITSMDEYKHTMKAKAKSAGIHIINQHAPNQYPASCSATIPRQRLNNNTTQKETIQHINQGINKTAVTKMKSKSFCSGLMCSSLCLLLVLLCSAVFLAYMKVPILQRIADKGGRLYMAVKPEIFTNHLSNLESRFPRQRPELWKRSKIHLGRHLKTAQPTEPVSLILTAGYKAEKTLHCLAEGLASSFSSVFNASVLHIDGASKAKQDSDEVKLDIDQQLQAAFAGDQPVAVIHRLEELPPGSTLIFYRYCDHENAAFKRVFLLFTVLLPQDEVSSDQSLQSVEEVVQGYVQKKLVGSNSQTSFNEMNIDKFGGLWSRISHLILPVVSEEEIQSKGCNGNKLAS